MTIVRRIFLDTSITTNITEVNWNKPSDIILEDRLRIFLTAILPPDFTLR